ncbi:ABC transporter substrate-binding protein [Roseateles aquatilis]|uniref:Putative aliphatic sulfonates-binding protein n=1 Tax=Roseateles aquatilis TaxID=431061 RepID=A0A246JDI0_9BURK|nr:aliphatic sulfonate ABC transporter substrate-binding protein [Roseateles aquatilis]OWQ90712.1 ABC transporter substrate-binding protein [Roseateles aquatilis]
MTDQKNESTRRTSSPSAVHAAHATTSARPSRRDALILGAGVAAGWTGLVGAANAQTSKDAPKEVRLDYAYYSPTSLVLRRFGWLEEDLAKDGIGVRWVLSAGSNRALEYLNAGSIDIGSTAGLAALLARANGNPIRAPYIFSRPEWTALVVRGDSGIRSLADLKGKKVAATKGTDPYLFLLRALHTAGLKRADIEHVGLQHADGRAALEQGRVDAWAGLDPLMAASELDAGSRLLYRNVGFNTYGFLNVREDFLARHPREVQRVILAYERARQWTIAHPSDAAKILSEEAKVSLPVALLQVKLRTDFSQPRPSDEHVKALQAAAPILTAEQLVRPGVDLNRAIAELVDTRFAAGLVKA